ncbi:MAG: ABC transporter ATP-binding protein, partial [Anaerolineales bacterium]
MAYLELKNVTKKFGNVIAVNDFNLDIERGSLVSFLGPSGCGKTTTLRMIAGFEQPDQGSITLDNDDITPIPPNKRDIGMVFQSYALFPNLSVRDNIAFGLEMKKLPKTEIKKRVTEVLEMVRLENIANRFPH